MDNIQTTQDHTILQKLKTATRTQHESLEEAVNVMDSMFDHDDYRSLLVKFYRFYRSFEPGLPLAELRAANFDYEPRRKLPFLIQDLTVLGVRDPSVYESVGKVPDVSTTSKAFGSLYVVEGSTLGGQIITRHLKQHLNVTPENGGAFFNSYGQNVGAMWKQFGEAITGFAANGGNENEILKSAIETFEGFRVCLADSDK